MPTSHAVQSVTEATVYFPTFVPAREAANGDGFVEDYLDLEEKADIILHATLEHYLTVTVDVDNIIVVTGDLEGVRALMAALEDSPFFAVQASVAMAWGVDG
jgi:hypothetical protein